MKKHPNDTIYGLDFGEIVQVNKNIKNDRLLLYPGYTLDTLEKFADDEDFIKFDYCIFARTVTLIDIEQLLQYISVISKISKNICFLEVAISSTLLMTRTDVSKMI